MKTSAELRLTHVTDPVSGTGAKGPWTKSTFIFTSGNDTIPITAFNHEVPPQGLYNVEFFIEGREYNGKYYTNLNLSKLTPVTTLMNTTDSPVYHGQPVLDQPQGWQPPTTEDMRQARNAKLQTNAAKAEAVNDLPF